MGLYKLKDIWKSSVYITPNLPVISTKRYKVPFLRILAYLGFYTFFVAIVVITILTFTGAKNLIFFMERSELENQSVRIRTMEKQILFLSNELKNVSATNRSLKFALLLADSLNIDTNSTVYDSLRIPSNEAFEQEGHVLSGFFNLVRNSYNFFTCNYEDSTQYYISPVSEVFITNGFAPEKGHTGIDFGVKAGTPVYAALGGLIIFSDYTISDGYKIIIQHNYDNLSIYKHCSEVLKKEREYVIQGELIALSGNSGSNSTGPHLHFEIWENGRPIDPLEVVINLN
ncbi:MAG: M23 family metallopeptidase [Melioribacteraceae bacterium]|nr:M23 family metallopeptidase [Melioribacteraceae bacterium]MCF8264636.1 M23 family metallopeptidase [Melioribacteraceae bacterium]MCF8411990.1 M23 family metallopeptidase [Melioribacteraceae bacterium]